MGSLDRKRLIALEGRLGHSLPDALVKSLTDLESIHEGNVALVTSERVWDVRTSFGLHSGADSIDQLDRVYELVSDVLPTGALPIAEDWGGNLYCLMLSGPFISKVVWWGHERDADDDSVQRVADSIAEFYGSLVPDPRDSGG